MHRLLSREWLSLQIAALFCWLLPLPAALAQGPADGEVTAQEICTAVRHFIEKQAPWSAEQLDIRSIKCTQALKVPHGKVTLQVSAPLRTDWLGAELFGVDVLVEDRLEKRISVPVQLDVWSDVVLAAKPLGRRQPITQADIRVERMNLTRMPADALVRPDQAIGCRANRPIAINTVLRGEQVQLPPLVRKGDMVQVLAESATLRVVTQAICQEDGGKGQRIRVANLNSKKTIYAQVVDDRMVRVDF